MTSGGGRPRGRLTQEMEAPEGAEEPGAEPSVDTGELAASRWTSPAASWTRRASSWSRPVASWRRRASSSSFSQSKGREMMERLKDSHERALRAAADLENYKKRAQKEKEEVQKFGSERLLKDLLPVVDNLDRALEAARSPPTSTAWSTGVEMTRKLFEDARSASTA